MNDKENFLIRSAKLLDIPQDAFTSVPYVEITGTDQAIVENHKGILEYDENLLTLNLGAHILTIIGTKLKITAMNEQGLRVSGHIDSLQYESV